MTIAEKYCKEHEPIGQATLSLIEAVQVCGIEHGIDDYIYVKHIIGSTIKHRRLKVKYTVSGSPYILVERKRIRFDEILKL